MLITPEAALQLYVRPRLSGPRGGRYRVRQRAWLRWRQMLQDYQAPPIEPAIDEALLDFVARKKASMEDAWY